LAQSSSDYNKVEFYGGCSYNRVQPNIMNSTAFGTNFELCSSAATDIIDKNFQTFFCERHGYNVFDTSITYNFNRHFGIKANITRRSITILFVDAFDGAAETNTVNERIYNFLGV
jgi:hypothetical protein